MKTWICERTCIATKTVLVKAPNKKEALRRLRNGEGDGIDVSYGPERALRVIGEDKLKQHGTNGNRYQGRGARP